FFVLAVAFGPFPDSDAPAALCTAFAGISAMAIQNGMQRVHFSKLPPTTLMTGNTTQAVLDGVDVLSGTPDADAGAPRSRLRRTLLSIAWFALGCALAAGLYYAAGFWCLALPVVVGAATLFVREDA